MNTLIYNNLTLIHIQIVSLPESFETAAFGELARSNAIQHELFRGSAGSRNPTQRYALPGFEYMIRVGNGGNISVKGTMQAEVTIYFQKFAVIRYNMLIDPLCITQSLSTENITELALLGDHEPDPIEPLLPCNPQADFSDLPDFLKFENNRSASFARIKQGYKRFLTQGVETGIEDGSYIFVDVHKGLKDSGGLFAGMDDESTISYISENMTAELSGLLLLDPWEWTCGRQERISKASTGNIALNTDELIMLNEKICVSFASYGKDCPVDWGSRLKDEHSYHVFWPEFYLILESVLIKNYALAEASEVFRLQASVIADKRNRIKDEFVEESLNRNANVRLTIANTFLQLDQAKLVSLRILAEEISERFALEKQMRLLETKMKYTDEALELKSNSKKLRQARILNIVLAILSGASVLGLLFNQVKPPVIQRLLNVDDYMAEAIGTTIITGSVIGILLCILYVLRSGNPGKTK